jgi:lipoprotein-anchoring transpeptidase ErfK/SrfK
MRILSALLLLAALASPALAAPPQPAGDPSIDAQWAAQLRRTGAAQSATAAPAPERRGLLQILFAPRRAPAPAAAAPQLARAPAVAAPAARMVDPAFLPALVDYPTKEKPGTIVIEARRHYLYLVLEGGQAQRYGVGVGREGFGWSGTVKIGRKAEWPTWTPPAAMRKRQPYLPVSMSGGPDNPLGARALYLYDGGRDTLFRIHGSNEPWTIGHNVSSGCIRMRNEDVTALYAQVGIGTRVVVR